LKLHRVLTTCPPATSCLCLFWTTAGVDAPLPYSYFPCLALMLFRPKLLHLVVYATSLLLFAPRLSNSQSACIESPLLNATLCYWDASNHSTVLAPAIVGLSVLPILHPNRASLFASLNGGPWIPLAAGAAAVPVPAVDDLRSCDSECSGDDAAAAGARCCAAVIDVWLVSHQSRTNIGCSLYFTVPAHAAPAAHPVFKFHGEINAGLQVSPSLVTLLLSCPLP
jgi:hypothetical protein